MILGLTRQSLNERALPLFRWHSNVAFPNHATPYLPRFYPLPSECAANPPFYPSNLEKPRANPSRSSNKWRLKQTKDNGVCLLSVLARTEFNHPPVDTLPLSFLLCLSRGRERKNITGFLFWLAKRFCLMVRAMLSKEHPRANRDGTLRCGRINF